MFLPFSPYKNSAIRSVVLPLMISSQIVFSMASGSGPFHQNTFRQLTEVDYSLEKTLRVWKHVDVVECALLCTMTRECTGFLWKSSEDTCITGYGAVANTNGDSDSDSSIKFYATLLHLCRYDLGYQLLSDGTHERCVFISQDKATSNNTKERCQQHGGGWLYKAGVPKFNMLLSELVRERSDRYSISPIILSLDDIPQEELTWSDGTVVTPTERESLGGSKQPGSLSEEMDHCLHLFVSRRRYSLFVTPCDSWPHHFVCEMDSI